MRKRQWKKILSMVLALAMVFTMNTSVFAEPLSDNETPAAEQTSDPAQTDQGDQGGEQSGTNTEGEQPQEEVVPETSAQTEQPVDQGESTNNEGAPAADPAQEPAPAVETGAPEAPNGGPLASSGWTIDDDTNTTFNNSSTPNTLTITSGDHNITATEDTVIDLDIINNGGGTVTIKGKNGLNLLSFDGITALGGLSNTDAYTMASTKLFVRNVPTTSPSPATGSTDDTTAINFVTPAKSSGYGLFKTDCSTLDVAELDASKSAAVSFYATKADGTFEYLTVAPAGAPTPAVAESDLVRGGSSVTIPAAKFVAANEYQIVDTTGKEVLPVTKGTGYDKKVTGLKKSTDYTLKIRTASSNDGTAHFASNWVDTDFTTTNNVDLEPYNNGSIDGRNIYFEWDGTGSKAITVSGLDVKEINGKSAKGKIVSENNIYTVTLSEGSVSVADNTSTVDQGVSFDAIANTGFVIEDSAPASISLKGAGTVSFASAASGKEINLLENTLSLSACKATPNQALVISENSGKKYDTSIYGKDEPIKTLTTAQKIKVFVAEGNGAKLGSAEKYNEVTPTAGIWVISNNMTKMKEISTAVIGLTKAQAGDAIGWGKTVFYADNEALTSNFKYQELKKRYENGVGSLTFFDANKKTDKAQFEIPANFDPAKTLFAISTDSAVPAATHEIMDEFVSANVTRTLDIDHLIKQGTRTALDAGKTYYVFAVSGNKTAGDFYSEIKSVGSFDTKKEQKLYATSTNGTIYYGGQNKAKGDAVSAGIISFRLGDTGYTIKEDTNGRIVVLDPNDMDTCVGWINVYVFKNTKWDSLNDAAFYNAKPDYDGYLRGLTGPAAADYKNVGNTNTLANMVSNNGYKVKAVFVPHTDTVGHPCPYGQISADTIVVNASPAPVRAEAQPVRASIKKLLTDGNVTWEKGPNHIKYVNKITGEEADPNEFEGEQIFRIGDKPVFGVSSTVSYASAGEIAFSISPNKIKAQKKEAGNAMYVVSDLVDGKLSIYGEVTKDNFTINTSDIFYGEGKGSIEKNFTVSYNNGVGIAKAPTAKTYKYYKKSALSANGTISQGSSPYDADSIQNLPAGTELYVEATVAKGDVETADTKATEFKVVSKLVTIKKRPVEIAINGTKDNPETKTKPYGTKRNITPNWTVSGGKAKAKVTELTTKEKLGTKEDHGYAAAAPAQALSKDAIFDMSYVDISTADNYEVPLNDVVLLDSKNFEVKKANGIFVVEPAFYAYFILEYGGHGNVPGKKKVYMGDPIYQDNSNEVTFKLPKDLQNSVSFAGAITDKNDKVDHYIAYKVNSSSKVTSSTLGKYEFSIKEMSDGVKFVAADFNNNPAKVEDLYFHAIVKAYATEDVYINTIPAVLYDGNKHSVQDAKDANGQHKDLELDIRDQSVKKNYYDGNGEVDYKLVYGTDYTVTVKNNVNASVKYDKSQAASSNTSDQGAITQLYSDAKKRPQVVIKGKGSYKDLKATVYFDVLPRNIELADADQGQLQTKKENDEEVLRWNYLKLGKKGGVTYKYKVVDNLGLWAKKDGEWNDFKTKKANLGAKDYEECLIQTNAVYPTSKLVAFKILGSGSKEAKAAAKAITSPGKYYAVQLEGKGNYCGVITYPVSVVGNDVMLLSELGWKTKKVAYKATGVSSDSAKGNFDVKPSKKLNKQTLKYTTDYTAVIRKDGNGSKMGDGTKVKDNLALNAGTYKVTIVPGASLKTQAESGKLILDKVEVGATIKSKALKANMFKVTPEKSAYSGKNIDNVKVTSKKSNIKEGEQYIALPGTIYLKDEIITEKNWDEVEKQLGESAQYLTKYYKKYVGGANQYEYHVGLKKAYITYNGEEKQTIAYPFKGVKVNQHKYEFTLNATNAAENGYPYSGQAGAPYGNSMPGTYYMPVIGKGEYATADAIAVPYKVEGELLDAKKLATVMSFNECYANVNGTTTTFNLKLPKGVKVKISRNDKYPDRVGKEYDVVNQYDANELGWPFFSVTYSKNTTATDKAVATIKVDPTTGYKNKSKKGDKKNFKISTRVVSKNQIHSLDEWKPLITKPSYALTDDDKTYNEAVKKEQGGNFYVVVNDKYVKDKAPVVKIYQANEDASDYKEIKSMKDYQFNQKLSGGTSGNSIQIYNGTLKALNYKYDKAPISINEPKFDVYSTKAKKWELQLSDNVLYVSADSTVQKRAFALGKKGDTGTVIYNGRALKPQIQNLTVDGIAVITNGKPQHKGVSCNVIYDKNVNVGTATMTITLKKDDKGYVVGGTKAFKFKIVPQPNTGLVLEK